LFDSDISTNENVMDAATRLAAALKSRGALVKIVFLPDGPDGAKMGIDDYLVAHGRDAFHELLKQAQDPEPVDAGVMKAPAQAIDSYPEGERFLSRHYTRREGKVDYKTLRSHRGEWFRYVGGGYQKIHEDDVRAHVKRTLHDNFFKLTTSSTSNVVDSIKAQTIVSSAQDMPLWLDGDPPFTAKETLATRSGLIHLPSLCAGSEKYSHPATARFFSCNTLEYAFDIGAPKPVLFLQFLSQLLGDDPASIETLQEFFGYCLLPDTSFQKILLIVGPRRSGKGTLGRILRGLVGENNVAGPTLAGLATNFGLAGLLNKLVAIVSDARIGAKSDLQIVVERLLSISGEDPIDIDRKYHDPLTSVRLPVRFVVLTNELPRLVDSSGALAGRLVIIRLTKSFFGHEDRTLTDRLLQELPSILLWAVEGWRRLQERGYFVQPDGGAEMVAEMEDLTSPVGQFARECCELGPEHSVEVDRLFDCWKSWCLTNNRLQPGTVQAFGRDLRAVAPEVKAKQHREDGDRVRAYVGLRLKP
jgi:putative DNA primase/helicase